jgi:hypothetical protein
VQQRGVEAPLYYLHTRTSLTLIFFTNSSHSLMTNNESLLLRIATLDARITLLERRLNLRGAAASNDPVKMEKTTSPHLVLVCTPEDK